MRMASPESDEDFRQRHLEIGILSPQDSILRLLDTGGRVRAAFLRARVDDPDVANAESQVAGHSLQRVALAIFFRKDLDCQERRRAEDLLGRFWGPSHTRRECESGLPKSERVVRRTRRYPAVFRADGRIRRFRSAGHCNPAPLNSLPGLCRPRNRSPGDNSCSNILPPGSERW
jgi:hypothetical protein